MFGLCEYTYQARNLLIETYMQHLGMNFLQGNYAQAILQQGTKPKRGCKLHFVSYYGGKGVTEFL
jgi:hypothetical protein